ncbi:hypothetical protein [Fulvivirga sediminis]|uniref:Uncharacterized protein n=1 Tax=Fulvivirga sediminis TaxID=2803949 RepID=A0A937FB79_9BACT|nr:hypothetical protein [Fulvivirga sediminis]MBL3657675.1 hypothetical protein [Fulvivirga sediminis]
MNKDSRENSEPNTPEYVKPKHFRRFFDDLETEHAFNQLQRNKLQKEIDEIKNDVKNIKANISNFRHEIKSLTYSEGKTTKEMTKCTCSNMTAPKTGNFKGFWKIIKNIFSKK